jgi:hypothetical protein
MEETVLDATRAAIVKIVKPLGLKPLVMYESILKPTVTQRKTKLVNHQKTRPVNQQKMRPGVTWSQIVTRAICS